MNSPTRIAMLIGAICALAVSLPVVTYAAEVTVFVQPDDYITPRFAALNPGNADYLFIKGEPVRFQIVFRNASNGSVLLNAGGRDAKSSVTMELVRLTGKLWLPIAAQFSSGTETSLVSSAGGRPIEWADRTELQAGDMLNLGSAQVLSAVEPGIYQLRVKSVNVSCESECEVRVQAGVLRFEMRSPAAPAEQAELLSRQALRAVTSGDGAGAEREIADLLRLFPRSAAGYQLKGERAEMLKDAAGAIVAYRTALALLVEHQDDTGRLTDGERHRQFESFLRKRIRSLGGEPVGR